MPWGFAERLLPSLPTPGQPPPSFPHQGKASKSQQHSAIGNTHVLQSINLAVCSVGQAVQASWLSACAGMLRVLERGRLGFESWV